MIGVPPSRKVILRTGALEAEIVFNNVMVRLSRILHTDRPAFWELVARCRNSAHLNPLVDGARLAPLIDEDGRPHRSVRNILLASIEEDGMEFKLVDPLMRMA